jgi:hypothetical protein
VSPDASGRSDPGLTRRKPAYQQMREELVSNDGHERYRRRAQIIEPVFAHTKRLRRTDRVQTPRTPRLPGQVASDYGHPQPAQALAAHQPAATSLSGAPTAGPRAPEDRQRLNAERRPANRLTFPRKHQPPQPLRDRLAWLRECWFCTARRSPAARPRDPIAPRAPEGPARPAAGSDRRGCASARRRPSRRGRRPPWAQPVSPARSRDERPSASPSRRA